MPNGRPARSLLQACMGRTSTLAFRAPNFVISSRSWGVADFRFEIDHYSVVRFVRLPPTRLDLKLFHDAVRWNQQVGGRGTR